MGKRAELPRGAVGGRAEERRGGAAVLCFGSYSVGVPGKPFIIIIHGYCYQVLTCSCSQGFFFFCVTCDKYCVFNLG